MIVLDGKKLRKLSRKRRSFRATFAIRDQDDVYTVLPHTRRYGASFCRGTVCMAKNPQEVAVSAVGRSSDRVRVIVSPSAVKPQPGGDGSSRRRRIDTIGYVLRDDRWVRSPVQIVPVQEDLYSRTKGLLETDVFADTTVFCPGLGSVGSYVTLELAKTGVGRFILADHDRLEIVNVVRHVAGISDVGRYKTKVMRELILEKNPSADVHTHEIKICWEVAELVRELIRQSGLVIIAIDDPDGRALLNKLCVEENTPCIFVGAFRRACGGQVLRVRPYRTPCYQCFLMALPETVRDQEVSNSEQAERMAYSDRPVAIEPGLSSDIAPLSQMVVKLAIQELIQGKPTTLQSLDEDLQAPWLFWLNRREAGTEYEHIEPLEYNIDGLHVLRWYGVALERDPSCPHCGDFLGRMAAKYGIEMDPKNEDGTSPPMRETDAS